jgi:hypothetical protein
MSYCRFIEADVYIFMSVGGWLECCGCSLGRSRFDSTQEMIDHIAEHRENNDYVPEHVIQDLWEDAGENFPDLKEI